MIQRLVFWKYLDPFNNMFSSDSTGYDPRLVATRALLAMSDRKTRKLSACCARLVRKRFVAYRALVAQTNPGSPLREQKHWRYAVNRSISRAFCDVNDGPVALHIPLAVSFWVALRHGRNAVT